MWQTINEVSKRKSPARAKLKAACQEKWIHLWKEHFKNLLGKSPWVTDEPITKIINNQLDIRLRQFTPELDVVVRKLKAGKLLVLIKYLQKYRRQGNSTAYCSDTATPYFIRTHPPFPPKKGDLRIAKNYWGITLTPIAAKIYTALLLNRIEPKIEEILRKNQNGFHWNWSTTSQILTICQILESVRAKNLEATLLFVDFSLAFDSIHRRKMEQILLVYLKRLFQS